MKNLVLDFGNTKLKIALFENKNLLFRESYTTLVEVQSRIEELEFDNAILSSVLSDHETQFFLKNFSKKIDEFDQETILPFLVKYETPDTLGKDRLANASFAWIQNKNGNSLIVDVGTCIKFDFVNSEGEYLGGSISPGIKLRLNSLSNYTGKLPLVSFNEDYQNLVGTDTNGSILTGVKFGMGAEINGMIQMYEEQYSDLTIFITGGDSDKFELKAKNSIFADNFITLKGLNEILLFKK